MLLPPNPPLLPPLSPGVRSPEEVYEELLEKAKTERLEELARREKVRLRHNSHTVRIVFLTDTHTRTGEGEVEVAREIRPQGDSEAHARLGDTGKRERRRSERAALNSKVDRVECLGRGANELTNSAQDAGAPRLYDHV